MAQNCGANGIVNMTGRGKSRRKFGQDREWEQQMEIRTGSGMGTIDGNAVRIVTGSGIGVAVSDGKFDSGD